MSPKVLFSCSMTDDHMSPGFEMTKRRVKEGFEYALPMVARMIFRRRWEVAADIVAISHSGSSCLPGLRLSHRRDPGSSNRSAAINENRSKTVTLELTYFMVAIARLELGLRPVTRERSCWRCGELLIPQPPSNKVVFSRLSRLGFRVAVVTLSSLTERILSFFNF